MRSPFNKWVRSLAILRYIRGNLSLQLSDLIRLHRAEDPRQSACWGSGLSEEDRQLTDGFIRALPAALDIPASHVILVFDSDRKSLYAGATPAAAVSCASRDELARRRLMQLARGNGLQVIDSYPVFQHYYAVTGRHVDYLPQDGHWNPAAHHLMALEVARVINASERSFTTQHANVSQATSGPMNR